MSLSATRWTIVQAAQAGDEAALRELCAKYWPAVVAWLRRRGLTAEAEDVAQETLLGLVRSALARAQAGGGRFRGLVFAIARNQLAKHLERERAAKRGAGRVQPLGEREVAAEVPDEDFDREWLLALLRAGLARLEAEAPEPFQALVACLLEGRPQAELAASLGTSANTVKKRVQRGKRILAGFLREEVWRYASSPQEYQEELVRLGALLGEPSLAVSSG